MRRSQIAFVDAASRLVAGRGPTAICAPRTAFDSGTRAESCFIPRASVRRSGHHGDEYGIALPNRRSVLSSTRYAATRLIQFSMWKTHASALAASELNDNEIKAERFRRGTRKQAFLLNSARSRQIHRMIGSRKIATLLRMIMSNFTNVWSTRFDASFLTTAC